MNDTFTLRPYQQQALNETEARIAFGSTNLILEASTGWGKTGYIAGICQMFDDRHIVIMVNIEPLIDQIAETLKAMNIEYSILKAGRESEFDESKRINIVMSQTFYARIDKDTHNIKADIFIQDECFTPDVEILTENGFIRFDKLTNEKVAQFNSNNENISFIKPIRKIQYKYDGEIYNITSKNNINVSTTPNHNFLINGKKIKTKNIVSSNLYKINVAGNGIGKSIKLTQYEKLAIAFQADGNMHCQYIENKTISPSLKSRIGYTPKKGNCSIIFSFSKERKIKQFLNDFSTFNIKKLKIQKSKNKNIKARKRFILTEINTKQISKKLSDIFKLEDFSKEKAQEFIEYMVIWDGHKYSENNYYYSSAIKENTDFIQAIAILAGYKAKVGIQIDNRKDSYLDMHRLYIIKNKNKISTQCIKKNTTIEHYSGNVYCVEVPDSNIIVRRNGNPIIIGNCHKEYDTKRTKALLAKLEPDVRISCSATPYDAAGFALHDAEIISTATSQDLTDQGYLSPLKFYVPKWAERINYSSVKKSGSDYSMASLDELIGTPQHINHIVESMNQMNAKNKKTLIFSSTIEMCDKLEKALTEDGYSVAAYHSKKSKKENKRIMDSFKNNAMYTGSDELLENKTLFNEAEEAKKELPIKCIVSVSKVSTGFSVSDIDLGVIVRKMGVRSLWTQSSGRLKRCSNSLTAILKKHNITTK